MITESDEDWRKSGGRAKRQRSTAQGGAEIHHDSSGDYFDEILEGRVNGTTRNSWLRSVSKIGVYDHFERIEGISPISSLSHQLLQVKRRLWPAALRCAEAYDSSPQKEFAVARRQCNPMEPLGEGRHRGLNQMFMNRSAIKLANIDAILNFSLTLVPGDHFLFVDLCGAPGGFSEYLMRRCQSTRGVGSCRGYGMSLVGTNEHGMGTPWKLDYVCEHDGAFETHYRVSGGADGTGDIYQWKNVEALMKGIQYDCASAGMPQQKVHFVSADGGFDAQRDNECQEAIAQKLVLCQIAAGLSLLCHGGTLLVKMFGFQTHTIRTAMRSLYDAFDDLIVLKPISSRPASSERYVICTGFRGVTHNWDGPQWMNSVLLGTPSNRDENHYFSLDRYLDEIDRDLFTLNLKACFAILSYLDRKTAVTHSWTEEKDMWHTEHAPLNVNMYKHAWRLH